MNENQYIKTKNENKHRKIKNKLSEDYKRKILNDFNKTNILV